MSEECSAVILVGGRSSRMGRPKAWLEFGGVPLLNRMIDRLAATFQEFVVVAAPGQDVPASPAKVVFDPQEGEGPLAGMISGLGAARHPLAAVLSCDAPFIDAGVLGFLIRSAGGVAAVVPEWGGRLHPLHAVYRTSVHPVLGELFAAGQRRPVALLERVPHRIVAETELRALDPEGRSFLNMNTPADYAAALALDAGRS